MSSHLLSKIVEHAERGCKVEADEGQTARTNARRCRISLTKKDKDGMQG